MPEAPLAELRVRVTGLGEWGTRIAELLGDSGLEARAIDSSASVRRTGLDPGRIHHLQVENRTAGRWAALARALSSDADLQAGLASDADCDLMMVAADVSGGAGVMLATLMKRMVKAAPGVSRLAIARLPETRSSPDRRARALVAVNALLEGASCGILLVQPPSDSALDSGDPRVVASRLRELVGLAGEELGDAVRGLGSESLVRFLSTPGFVAWRELDLAAEDCARDAQPWFERLAEEPASWQPAGFEWPEAQAVLPLVRAPRAWLESGGRGHFEKLVRDAWEEAAPCELQPALYEGEPGVAWLVAAGMAFPRSILALRDGVREDRARLAEKRRAAVEPIPLGEDFLASAAEIAPPHVAEHEPAPEPAEELEIAAVAPTEEIGREEAAGSEESAGLPEAAGQPEMAGHEVEAGFGAAGDTESPPGPAAPEPRADEPVPARAPAEAIYHTALGLARRIFRARDPLAEIDVGQIRYALYDLLERLRADPGSLL
ncbi:MAG TPA: hypothetical protein VFH11_05915, partial [Gemmatimonadota bacterium]|nr:hypothetical protein [Gemmatimonadota bacterium]